MKIGLFFGSFNPVHIGHLALANYFIEFTDLEQLWFIISPHNPLKKKESLLNDNLRLDLVETAIKNDDRFKASDIEFRMPQPSYTIDTLTYLSEKYPRNKFVLLMGSDGLHSFHKWKNHTEITIGYERYVYPRKQSPAADYKDQENIKIIEGAPEIEVSSSFIRQAIKEGKDIRHFLPPGVWDMIEKYNLYR